MDNTVVKSMLDTVEKVFEATHKTISSMENGQRMQVKNLVQSVSESLSMDSKQTLPLVNHYLQHTNIAYVTRGKNGGVIKGTRPAKPVSQV
jgi:hypothetical protein